MDGARSFPARCARGGGRRGGSLRLLAWPAAAGAILLPLLYGLRAPQCERAAFTPAERRALRRNLSSAAVRGVPIEHYVTRDDAGGAVLASGTPNP